MPRELDLDMSTLDGGHRAGLLPLLRRVDFDEPARGAVGAGLVRGAKEGCAFDERVTAFDG